MATITIYPDVFCRDIHERYTVEGGVTLAQWLILTVPSYDPNRKLFTALVNDQIEADYNRPLLKTDRVDIYLRPQAPLVIASIIITVLSLAWSLYQYFSLKTPKTPDLGIASPIYDANIQANRARLRSPIPEVFGYHLLYPDVISAPWREYRENSQWINLLLCIGVGKFSIDGDKIYIGNTPVIRYGPDVDYQIFEPGEDVTGHIAHRNIYTSQEVGASQSSSGLEIFGAKHHLGEVGIMSVVFDFSGTTLKFRLTVAGLEIPDFSVSEFIQIVTDTGTNDGDFRVDSYNPSTQTFGLTKMLPDLSDVDPAWTAFTTETGITGSISTLDESGAGGYAGPYLACPLSETTQKIMLDFKIPSLYRINRDGEENEYTLDWDIEYRDANAGGSYTVVPQSYTDLTISEIGLTIEIDLPEAITPEVRVIRQTASRHNPAVGDQLYWTALKSELESKSSYDGVTILAITARGTNVIAAQSENQFNLEVTRMLPVISSGFSPTEEATRDISAAFRYIISDIGVTDNKIDIEELNDLHDIWTERGDTFDAVFDQPDTFFEALKKVLRPGYSVPVIENRKFTVVRDAPRTIYDQMYQPDNILTGGIESSYNLIDEDEPDGIEVEYFDAESWRPETVLATLPDDDGIMPESLQAFGITDRTRAWRLGMRVRRERRYRRIQHTWKTELDGLNSRFGNFCALGNDIPGYSQTGIVVSYQSSTLGLSNEVDFEASGAHYIVLRKPNGRLSGPYAVTKGEDDFHVVLSGPLDFTPIFDGSQEPPLYQFGVASRIFEQVLITDVKPQGMESVSVTAFNYDERVYSDDDNEPPEES